MNLGMMGKGDSDCFERNYTIMAEFYRKAER